jgi:hypothetical protein
MKYTFKSFILILLFCASPLYGMFTRDSAAISVVAITMALTREQPNGNQPTTLATLQASFKIMQSTRHKEIEQTDSTRSPYLMVEHEGITPQHQITLCYTAEMNGQRETFMNHFSLAKKTTKEFETTLNDSSGSHIWLTITCTPK